MKTLKQVNQTIEEAESLLREVAKELEEIAGSLPKVKADVPEQPKRRYTRSKNKKGRITTPEETLEATAILREAISREKNKAKVARKAGIQNSAIWRILHPEARHGNSKGMKLPIYLKLKKLQSTWTEN